MKPPNQDRLRISRMQKRKMHFTTIIAAFLLAVTQETFADTPARVLLPFGEAAVWAANNEAVVKCSKESCDDEMKMGISQALKYALNNARIALRHTTVIGETAVSNYTDKIDDILFGVAKLDDADPESKKWKKLFNKATKQVTTFFSQEEVLKVLKETKVTMDIPSDDIGLTWTTASYDIPIYKEEDIKKGLAELHVLMRDGVEIPRIGFGTWQMEGDECRKAVLDALRIGYRHIDTAESYENEKEVGMAIQDAIKEGIINSRDEVFLSTKISDPKAYDSTKLKKKLLSQLELLQTNYTDVYMLHGPEEMKKNRAAWKRMVKLHKEGKIKALGISNFETVEDIKNLARKFDVKPNYIQNKFSIYNPGGHSTDMESMLQVAEERGMAFVAYSVINRWPFVLPPLEDPHVVSIATRYNKTAAQILHRWALQLNTVIIPKSKNAERIKENAEILGFALGEIDMRLLNGLSILAQSTTEQQPKFVKDVYELFTSYPEEKNRHDEL